MVQTGAKAQRVYVLSVQQEFDKACGRETHILAPETADGMPRLNEKAMRVYDNMIAEADKQGIASDPAVYRPLVVVGRARAAGGVLS